MTSYLSFFIFALGVGFTTASLTPDVKGPGWLAFGATYLVGFAIEHFQMERKLNK